VLSLERVAPTRPVRAADVIAVVAPVVFVGALVVQVAAIGLPTDHVGLFAWIGGGLLAFSVRSWRSWPRLLVDWLPILALLVVYDMARGQAQDVGAAHHSAQIAFDRFLGGGVVPTNWLQDQLHDPASGPAVWDYAAWVVYVSHFFVPWVTLAVLWHRSRERFRALRNRLVALTVAGCTIYTLYPADPPWLAGMNGDVPLTFRLIRPMWDHVGLHSAQPLYEPGTGLVNVVAAVPSLHAAYPCLLMLFFWRSAGRFVRAGLVAYTFAMGFTLVYSGEHFVFDIVTGWLLAGAVVAVFPVVAALRRRRRDAGLRRAVPGP
jgi:hypothetical protein